MRRRRGHWSNRWVESIIFEDYKPFGHVDDPFFLIKSGMFTGTCFHQQINVLTPLLLDSLLLFVSFLKYKNIVGSSF